MSGKLTPKQQTFVRAYLETGNASEAYRRAYDASRMKPETVKRKAAELMVNGNITATLEAEQAKIAERHAVTVDRIIAEYAAIAFADAGDFFDWGPNGVRVVDKASLTPVQRRVVAEASQTVTESGGTIRVKLHDKLTALDRLGKHLGMFPDKVEGSLKLDATDAFHRIVQYISEQRPAPKLIVPPAADDGPRASAGVEGRPA